jgi:L-aspartate oxidase
MAITSDALVIGSGLAALSYALEASKNGRDVVVITKRGIQEANTHYAQGGIAAVLRQEDSFESHIEDTLKAGAGLCRRSVVESVVKEGPAVIQRLIEHGVQFDKSDDPEREVEFDLAREGGHSHRRVFHAGDMTGAELMRGLIASLLARKNVRIYEEHCAVDLITVRKAEGRQGGTGRHTLDGANRVLGAYILDTKTGKVETFLAKAVVLATGGASKVYLYTTNPDVATGDGIAMGWRVGAEVANMEFIQFHPTALYHPRAKSFLISEALRGEGGILRRQDGTRFMESYHPLRELAPRDIVARAIDSELKRTGDDFVLLDMTHLEAGFLARRFPNIHATCLSFGIDLTKEPIPVSRRPTTSAAGSARTNTGSRRCPACSWPAKFPAPACTAPTAWPPTASSKPRCSGTGPLSQANVILSCPPPKPPPTCRPGIPGGPCPPTSWW